MPMQHDNLRQLAYEFEKIRLPCENICCICLAVSLALEDCIIGFQACNAKLDSDNAVTEKLNQMPYGQGIPMLFYAVIVPYKHKSY